MSRLVRSIAIGGAAFIVAACAQIAGIDDVSPTNNGSSVDNTSKSPNDTASSGGTSGSSGAPSSSGSSGTTSSGTSGSSVVPDGGTSDAAPDAPAPVCVSKKPNGQSCEDKSECCSDSCNEDEKCHDKCRNAGNVCDPFGDDCCRGTYCPIGTLVLICKACIAKEGTPDNNLAKSCCSRSIKGGKCE